MPEFRSDVRTGHYWQTWMGEDDRLCLGTVSVIGARTERKTGKRAEPATARALMNAAAGQTAIWPSARRLISFGRYERSRPIPQLRTGTSIFNHTHELVSNSA